MAWGAISVAGSIGVGLMGMDAASKNRKIAQDQYREQKNERERQQRLLDVEKERYKNMQFRNPFQDMENTFEDLTVNQQQAQFQAQQSSQQLSDILSGLRDAAGASGIAGLAQSLANQGALQVQRLSANIGQQEAANQRLAAQGAMRVQMSERQGEQNIEQAMRDRQATLLGMQMGEATGANQAFAQAQANQMNAEIAQQQALISGLQNVVSTGFKAGEAGAFDYSAETGNPFLPNMYEKMKTIKFPGLDGPIFQ
tara:strand:+ start:2435 stop:3199 length:765 start_codon:yes stop_codon:yes gene_type:complete